MNAGLGTQRGWTFGFVLASGLAVWLLPNVVFSRDAEVDLALSCASSEAAQFERFEFLVHPAGVSNVTDQLEVIVTGPDDQQPVSIPVFLYQPYERRRVGAKGQERDWLYPSGMPDMRARFAPTRLGSYHARVNLKRAEPRVQSPPVSFRCVPSSNPGFIQVSREDPRFLELSAGRSFFPLGQNLAFIGPQQHVTLSKAERIFAQLSENGANYVRIWAGCDDWALGIEARKSAWGRSWDWHPPIVPMPGENSESNRLCLRITGDKPVLPVNPSYAVALRPGGHYVVEGRVRTDPDTSVELEIGESKLGGPLALPESDWVAFRREFDSGPEEFWLPPMSFHRVGPGTVWLADLSLHETPAGPELLWEADVNRPARGVYNPLDCFMLDELLGAAQQQGIYVQLCLLTRDLYMSALKDPSSAEYTRAIEDAQKLFRYAVGRWGAFTSLGAWEYWNEMNPKLPTDRFYAEVGEFLERTDPYAHMRTTSTWGPSAKDGRHPQLDIADVHFYLRPADKDRLADEVDAVLERSAWLREQAPKKPAHLGEFGIADDKWRITEEMQNSRELVDVHNALWASALSGTAGSALPWWWERIDQRDGYKIYQPLSRFLADVPWSKGHLQRVELVESSKAFRGVGLQSTNQVWLWLFARDASWANLVSRGQQPKPISNAAVTLQSLSKTSYSVQWWDTRRGEVVREERVTSGEGGLRLTVPEFVRDMAVRIKPQPGG